MKNVTLTLCLSLLGLTGIFAQGDAINRFFSHYIGKENITDIQLSGNLFRMMSDGSETANSEENDFMRIAAKVTSIRILVDAEDKNGRQTMNDASKKLSGAYETMLTVSQKDNLVEMYVAETDDYVSELVLAVGGDQSGFVVMSIRGKFHLDDLTELSGAVAKSVQTDIFSGTKVEKANFKVWPNPASVSEKITLAIPNDMLGAQLDVFDTNGRNVHQEYVNQIEKSLNLSHLHAGTYVLKMSKDEIVVNKKLVIR